MSDSGPKSRSGEGEPVAAVAPVATPAAETEDDIPVVQVAEIVEDADYQKTEHRTQHTKDEYDPQTQKTRQDDYPQPETMTYDNVYQQVQQTHLEDEYHPQTQQMRKESYPQTQVIPVEDDRYQQVQQTQQNRQRKCCKLTRVQKCCIIWISIIIGIPVVVTSISMLIVWAVRVLNIIMCVGGLQNRPFSFVGHNVLTDRGVRTWRVLQRRQQHLYFSEHRQQGGMEQQ